MSTLKLEYGYADGSGNTVRPTSVRYPDGRLVTYDYGSADGIDDRLSRVAALHEGPDPLAAYAYLGAGSFVRCAYPQPAVGWDLATGAGANPYAGLDRFGRVIDNRWRKTSASSSSSSSEAPDVDRIEYGYDRASNRLWRHNVTASAEFSGGQDELYAYDGVQRLVDLQRGDLDGGRTAITGLDFAEAWALDATGNWNGYRQDENGGGWDLEQTRTANAANEITAIVGGAWAQPEYDRAGNTTVFPQPADPTAEYEAVYDAWNRLVRLEDGSTTAAEYAYDGLNRRVTVDDGVDVRHAYFSHSWQALEERLNAETEPERQFVWGLRYLDDLVLRDRRTAESSSSSSSSALLDERLYALQDANWNVTAVIDDQGDVQERYRYSAYGTPTFLNPDFSAKPASDCDWETLYAGYRFDPGTGLYLVRWRYLHAGLGRWITRDPIGYGSGTSLYGCINILNVTDPFGLLVPLGATAASTSTATAATGASATGATAGGITAGGVAATGAAAVGAFAAGYAVGSLIEPLARPALDAVVSEPISRLLERPYVPPRGPGPGSDDQDECNKPPFSAYPRCKGLYDDLRPYQGVDDLQVLLELEFDPDLHYLHLPPVRADDCKHDPHRVGIHVNIYCKARLRSHRDGVGSIQCCPCCHSSGGAVFLDIGCRIRKFSDYQ